MQKYLSDVDSEQTVMVVNLPDDSMKGRIIRREGRNILNIGVFPGVDLSFDDTPEAIVLISFDQFRREIAKLDTLIKDGRIHSAYIEEISDKTTKDMRAKIIEYSENALLELGIRKVVLIKLIGKIEFRTSYEQNA